MKTDLKKLRADAAEAQSKASYRKALSLYEEVCEADPTDPLAHHRAGELHMRLGKPAEAVRRLRQGADLYAEQGFLVKAIAVCKIILQMEPNHEETLGALIDLYSRKSQTESKGPQQMQPVADSAPQAEKSNSADSIALSTNSSGVFASGAGLPSHMMGNMLGSDDQGGTKLELQSGNVAPTGVNATLRGAGSKDDALDVALPDPNEMIDLGIQMAPATQRTPAPTGPARGVAPPSSAELPGLPPLPAGQKRKASDIRGGTPRALPQVSASLTPSSVSRTPSSGYTPTPPVGSPSPYGARPPSPPVAAAPVLLTPAPPAPAPALLTNPLPYAPRPTEPPPKPFVHARPPELLTLPVMSPPLSPPIRPALSAAQFAEGGIRTQKVGEGDGLPPELYDAIEISIDDDEDFSVVSERPRVLPETVLFAGLGKNVLTQLADRLEFMRLQEGEVIAREGEVGDSLYVIADGEVVISVQGPPAREVGRLKDGEFFGEISVISDFPRTATVTAARETEVLRLSRAVIWELVEEHPEFLATLIRFVKMRLMETLQKTSPLFLALPAPERPSFAARFKLLEVENDHVVVEQGKRSEGLFVLLGGRFEVIANKEGERVRVAELGPGSIVGEVSLLTRQPAVSTVKTTRRSWVLWMSPSTFSEMLMTYPTVLEYVHELAEERREAVARLQMA